MAIKDQQIQSLTKDHLYQMIVMSPLPLGRNILSGFYKADDKNRTRIDTILADLLLEGKILLDGDASYRATRPWSDIAYAIVGPIQPKKRTAIKILNLPEKFNPVITLSRQDVHKHKLETGDRIVVGLIRDNNGDPELKARFLARKEADRNFSLAGTFNHNSHIFTILDRNIKTEFMLTNEPAENGVPRQFVAEIPADFDVRKPVLKVIADQTKDFITGDAISWIVTRKHNIAYNHPADVLEEARILTLKKVTTDGRVDLRALDFVTVDPLGAQDLDDAFFARVENDGYAVYTAIADVPYIVPYQSKVDEEAYRRGLTHYLSDSHTVHMLPPSISTKKSSLIPNSDRASIVVKQILDWKYNLKGFEIFPAVIRSKAKLSYGQFYDMIDSGDPRFITIAQIHDERRRKGLDKNLAAFLRESPDRYATKSIVETLMVQTNSLSAQLLSEKKIPFLSRNFMQSAAGHSQKGGVVQRAYYSSVSLGHTAIGLTHYAHISSPIRRYADNINQRCLHRVFGTLGLGVTDAEISQFEEKSAHLNGRRDIDQNAMHDIQKYHAMPDLVRLQSTPIRVGIQEIGPDYVDIIIIQTGLRQRLPVSALPVNQWKIDATNHELILLDKNGLAARRYSRTETLLGQLYDVDPQKARWKIALIPSEPSLRSIIVPAP